MAKKESAKELYQKAEDKIKEAKSLVCSDGELFELGNYPLPLSGDWYKEEYPKLSEKSCVLHTDAVKLYSDSAKLFEQEENYGMAKRALGAASKYSLAVAQYGERTYGPTFGHGNANRALDNFRTKSLVNIRKYLQRREDRKQTGLEKSVATTAIIGLVGGAFFCLLI